MTAWRFPVCLVLAGMTRLYAAMPQYAAAFTGKYCTGCHNTAAHLGGLDLTTLPFDSADLARWVRVHDRLRAGEMPPKAVTKRPSPAELEAFLSSLASSLNAAEARATAT